MEEKIYEFDPQVYPMKLWVMKKPDFETVQKHFTQWEKKMNCTSLNLNS